MKKKSKDKSTKAKDVMYSPIYEPIPLRRHVLLSQIDVIKLLEKYEIFKKIRNDKRRLMGGIRHKVNELNDHLLEFKRRIPEMGEEDLKKEKKPKEVGKVKIVKPVAPKTQPTDINLKKQLNELQEKLKRLNI